MATIIDELIVRLGIDSKDLTSKGGNATKTLKEIGKTSKESVSSVNELTGAFGKMLAVIGGAAAIKVFVSDMIQSSAALDRLSKNLEVSAGEITAWGNAAEQLGGSAKGVQASMSMLSKAQTDIQLTGESGLIPYFNYLGVSLADASGKARKVTDVLADLSSAAEGKDRRQMVNIFAKMGFDESTINLLVSGRKELDISLAHQKDYAEKMKQFSGEATKLQRSLVDLKQTFTLLGLNLLQQAAPALEKVLGVLSSVGSWIGANKQFIGDFLKVMAVGLAALGLEALPLDSLVLAIAAVGTAIALLWQDYQTFQRGGQSLIPWDKWKPGIDAAIEGARILGKVWVTELMAIAGAVSFVQKALNGDWGGAQKALASWTEKMNKKWGIAGPDEAHDQNASKADGLVRKGAQLVKSTVKDGGKASKAELMAYYMSKGKSNQEAAALAANAWSESSGDPTVSGDNGAAYGLLQWHKDRQDDFKKKYGFDIRKASWQQQADFQMFELSPQGKERRAGAHMAGARTAADMAAIESRESQRPADKDGAASSRSSLAQALMGIRGASSTVAMAGRTGSSSTANDNRVSNHIENVNITAPSGDAGSIARAFRTGLDGLFPAVAVAGIR